MKYSRISLASILLATAVCVLISWASAPELEAKKKKKAEEPTAAEEPVAAPEEAPAVTSEEVIETALKRPKRTEWEYIAIDLKPPEKEKEKRKWDAMGRDGWELTGMRMKAGDTDIYIFKRQIIEE